MNGYSHFKITKKCDIFSMGCIFYYMITKQHPFGDIYERELNIIKGKYFIENIKNYPEAYLLIEWMIQTDPNKR